LLSIVILYDHHIYDNIFISVEDNKCFEENIEVDLPNPDVNNIMLEKIDISPEKHEQQ